MANIRLPWKSVNPDDLEPKIKSILGPNRKVTRQKKNVTLVAAATNILLAACKLTFGFVGRSEALIADGIHSLSDLLTDIVALLAIKFGSQSADREHPYGHARFETVATVILGAFLLVVAGGIVWDAVGRLLHPEQLMMPGSLALATAVMSIVLNEGLFFYTRQVATRTHSKLLMANAWHHRSDSLSSIIVVIGLAGTLLGFASADAVAAILVGLMIARIGFQLVLDSTRELVDHSLSPELVEKIHAAINATDGVKAIHSLRSRMMGGNALIDLHVMVDSAISVSEGHVIGDAVRNGIRQEFEEVVDVLVHIDPEDDERASLNENLPLRGELIPKLNDYWRDAGITGNIQKINLHYFNGKVEVEVILPRSVISGANTPEAIDRKFALAEKKLGYISDVRVYYAGGSKVKT